jgi:hypothetical protein
MIHLPCAMLVRTERRPEQRLCCVTQSAIWVGSSITRAYGRINSSDRRNKPWYDRHGEAAAKSGRRRSRQQRQRDTDSDRHDEDQRLGPGTSSTSRHRRSVPDGKLKPRMRGGKYLYGGRSRGPRTLRHARKNLPTDCAILRRSPQRSRGFEIRTMESPARMVPDGAGWG